MIYSRRIPISGLLFLLLLFSVSASAQPAVLTGTVSNAITGHGITGARISLNNQVTYSVSGGSYSMNVSPGSASAACIKTGFDQSVSPVLTLTSGGTATFNFQLNLTPSPAGMVSASTDTVAGQVVVPVSWAIPSGPSEIIYDDGVQDDFTVWAQQGNLNAVRFTPPGYPARITGGRINTGTAANYPPNSYPFVPFQVVVYNSSGPGGTPGTLMAGPFDVSFTALGWVEVNIPVPPVLNSGDFYLIMIQGGNAPNAAGLAIDNSNSQNRSFSRFTSGTSQWIPASGNFMMRAIVDCPGGPLDLTNNPLQVTGYTVFRLKQGEELNPAVWLASGNTTGTSITDPSWPSLPCGPYRWGVQAHYPGNLNSPAAFSNVLGKCWTAGVHLNLTLSCAGINPYGSSVIMKNLVYPDTLYSGIFDSSGGLTFPKVWKGTYELRTARFGYTTSVQNINVSGESSFTVNLMQEKVPPGNFTVNDSSLAARWSRPRAVKELFKENWDGGTFLTNAWTIEGGTNWQISMVTGQPKPSVMFGSAPQVSAYQQTLTSRLISGENSSALTLRYDISLDNFGTTTINQMAVELWDGVSWHTLQQFDNTLGSVPWATREADLSAWSGQSFKIRFMASGGDSFDINKWNIDNISILAEDNNPLAAACVLGYNFYLDNIACAFLTDTNYIIPPALVQYGSAHTACVSAVYGSGTSANACASFTSHYLVPPGNLQGIQTGDKPFLTWTKPQIISKSVSLNITPPGLLGYYIYKNGLLTDSVASPDSLHYTGQSLFPGTYSFGVSAKYDLSFYGQAGQTAESAPAGPVSIIIYYGLPLPFSEDWNSLSFMSNSWGFDPVQGNWTISPAEGNPLPDARFSADPQQIHYSCSLESQVILAQAVSCAKVWFDFDLRLTDRNLTSMEHLAAEVYYNDAWHLAGDFVNNGNIPWTSFHNEISAVKGGFFRIRFRAFGENSEDIIGWEVDNIHVYAVCAAPRDLSGDPAGFDVRLTWSPPNCLDGNILNEGFEENGFPPSGWTKHVTNSLATWFHASESSPAGVHAGSWAAGLTWDYSHQDEWLIAENVYVTGNLAFWSYAFQGSIHLDHYYVKLSQDHGSTWTILLDMSALAPFGSTGYNQWEQPYQVNLSAYLGQVVDIAWEAVDGDGLGLWYPWAIDDCRVGSKKISFSCLEPVTLTGYNIYRKAWNSTDFIKVNNATVYDTTFMDAGLDAGLYHYFVMNTSAECSSSITSDTVQVDVITGLGIDRAGSVTVFPNPASVSVMIRGESMVYSVELFDLQGRKVDLPEFQPARTVRIPLNNITGGVYIVKIVTGEANIMKKIIVINP